MKKLALSTLGVLCIVGLTLQGCGGGGSNEEEETTSNVLQLDNSEFEGVIGSDTRAVISGKGEFSKVFEDHPLGIPAGVRPVLRLHLEHGLENGCSVRVPEGATLPASFTIGNIEMEVTIKDREERALVRRLRYNGRVTYTRVGTTSRYETSTDVLLEDIVGTTGDREMIRSIITTAPSPNLATVVFRFDTDDAQLPAGSGVRFRLVAGRVRIGM